MDQANGTNKRNQFQPGNSRPPTLGAPTSIFTPFLRRALVGGSLLADGEDGRNIHYG